MLKFKQIRKSIINSKIANPLQSKHSKGNIDDSQIEDVHNLSFKKIKNQFETSPFSHKKDQPLEFKNKFDTTKKKISFIYQKQMAAKSDTKQNDPKHYYTNVGTTFSQLSAKKLQFQPVKKIQRAEINQYYETFTNIEYDKNQNGTLSFSNLLKQSKKPRQKSKNKFKIQSDRKNERQSSISKLKEKLFGMKKIISQKQKRSENAYNLYQYSKFDPKEIDIDQSVKISMKQQTTSDLDMQPNF